MINRLHSWLHRPESGWDPVSEEHAQYYAHAQWQRFDEVSALIAQLEERLQGLQDKSVLDLGGGPGHYSVAFALRGARVTWHDISRRYQTIVHAHAVEHGVRVSSSLGYLEQAEKFLRQPFDLVFNRGCWFYCIDDRAFAKLIYDLVRPGGAGYVEGNTPAFDRIDGGRRLQYFLNEHFYYKIGHPHPPHGRMAELLQRFPHDHMSTDYASPLIDKVFFIKSNAG
jgi:SAM-dependent methyltransferase